MPEDTPPAESLHELALRVARLELERIRPLEDRVGALEKENEGLRSRVKELEAKEGALGRAMRARGL